MNANSAATIEPDVTASTDTGLPARRIRSATQAWARIQELRRDNSERSKALRILRDMYDGHPPYSESSLRAAGLAWISNVNFRELENAVDRAATDFVKMVTNIPALAEIDCELVDPQRPDIDFGTIAASAFSATMRRYWPQHPVELTIMATEMMLSGIGAMVWPDATDWKSRAPERGKFLIPSGTSVTRGADNWVFEDEIPWDKLQEYVAGENHWNKEQIQDAVVRLVRQNSLFRIKTDWNIDDLLSKAREYATEHSKTEGLPVVHLYTQEISGKVSWYILAGDFQDSRKKDSFLFKFEDAFDENETVAVPYFFSPGDGKLRGSKGYAHRGFGAWDISNRSLNQAYTSAIMGNTLIMEGTIGTQAEDVTIQQLGPVTVTAGGAIKDTKFAPNIEGLMVMRQAIKGLAENATDDDLRSNLARRDRNRTTEASGNHFATPLPSVFVDCQMVQHGLWLKETFRRLLKSTDEAGAFFRARMAALGVPEELQNDMTYWTVSAVAPIGSGSLGEARAITREIIGMGGLLDEPGRVTATRMHLMSLVGWRKANRLKPPVDRNKSASAEATQQIMENEFFRLGRPIPAAPEHLHAIHLSRLYPFIGEMIQGANDGQIDPETAANTLGIALNHGAEHIDFLSQDITRKKEVRAYMTALREYAQYAQKIGQDAAKAQRNRAAQTQAAIQTIDEARQVTQNTELQEKLAKINADLQVRMVREESLAQERERKSTFMMGLKERELQAKLEREDRAAE